jgi:ubiquinone/menaquinone biosynthesis C-methylase UbiE
LKIYKVSEKQQVRKFYDRVAWKRQASGSYTDAVRFDDLRSVTDEYRRRCNLRVNHYLKKRGKYLLDIASGPIQFPEYLTFSEGYDFRICADISHTALVEAKKVLDKRSFYIQCDITHLPFKANIINGIVSLHTIYHVPAAEQRNAFLELHRVLKPNGQAVVVYSWANHSLFMKVASLPYRAIGLARRLVKKCKNIVPTTTLPTEPLLYFRAFPYSWFKNNLKPIIHFDIVVWRSVNVAFLKTYIHRNLFGNTLLRWIFRLEELWPAILGRIGAYPMFILKKK